MKLDELRRNLVGDLYTDSKTRLLYATDASLYEEAPVAVATPACDEDIAELIKFANTHGIGLIPRTAGTSLAGQVVGSGIIVDVSKHLTKILELDSENSCVTVQPGVIRDDLNRELAKHDLLFAPETSTANRAMIGGMIGNNSSGANSILHGDTRSHVLQLTGFLSDGTKATFGSVDSNEFQALRAESTLLGAVYRAVHAVLNLEHNRFEIQNRFPRQSIHRRNTGYALDKLIDTHPYGGKRPFNFCNLLAGSEGTLFFISQAKLNCIELPNADSTLICAHFNSVDDALRANIYAMERRPSRCEVMDHFIIRGIRDNDLNETGIKFIRDDPAAVLMVEFRGHDHLAKAENLADELKSRRLGYSFPLLGRTDAAGAWQARKAALGGLSNVDRGKTAVAIIEDAAVDIHELPSFVAQVSEFLARDFETDCVVYGHAGAGELHLRPWLDLNDENIDKKLRAIATQFAELVKRYRGALSGEHGSGRCRSEFIEFMVGEECYRWMRQIKSAFDPHNIFNPGKIVDAVAMDKNLRADNLIRQPDRQTGLPNRVQPTTGLRFVEGGLAQAVLRCSGSGDCRKSHMAGGTMCPSYHATRNESETTRGRANLLRQHLLGLGTSRVSDHEARDILNLCLSCKACKTECPSNVDMAKIKSEFIHQYNLRHGIPLRDRVLANFERWCERMRKSGSVGRFIANHDITSGLIKQFLGIHPNRKLPIVARESLRNWYQQRKSIGQTKSNGRVLLFCDEFTNQIDVRVGRATIELLESLGYEVELLKNVESGRSAISLGRLTLARKLAEENIRRLAPYLEFENPIVGIEPSSILTLRDEYPALVTEPATSDAKSLSDRVATIDEFIGAEIDRGTITEDHFRNDDVKIRFHGHCHQKAITGTASTLKILSLPRGSQVDEIAAGCCGMAGFFGYDRTKFEISQQIGELVLFPEIRKTHDSTIIAANGTSCRQQIRDAIGVQALHPMEVLRKLLKSR